VVSERDKSGRKMQVGIGKLNDGRSGQRKPEER
jgi:hypothetical protein